MTSKEIKLEKMMKPVVESLGYGLYDVEYVKEGKEYFVRAYITHPEKSIGLDDCELVSNAISDVLDKEDPIETSYSLEISSCGLEPKLREKWHFEAALGKKVEVRLFQPIEKEKVITGTLESVSETGIMVDNREIAYENVGSAKILFDWEESENG